jgi:hypothetical protein
MRLYNPSPRLYLTTTPAEQPAKLPPSSFPRRSSAETALQLLIHALALLGWREGAPVHAAAAAKIDQEIVAHTRCLGCKKKALRYHAWHRPRRGYLAVTICQACGHVEEI